MNSANHMDELARNPGTELDLTGFLPFKQIPLQLKGDARAYPAGDQSKNPTKQLGY